MKQILQDLSKGCTYIIEAPTPSIYPGTLLISTTASLISAGTERMLVDFGKGSYLQKARQQPDKVKMVMDKVKTDGFMTTYDAVRSKLAQPIPLGYSNVGVVTEVGKGVGGFKQGDRVVSNGNHADTVVVPKKLCAKIPDNVSDESAAFTVLASIGLQGIRLVNPTLGESVVVTGVGLIGLLTVQLLKAQGCRVLAIDYDQEKLELARKFGAEICNPGKGEDPVAAGMAFSRGLGVDAVIIAAATKSSDPVAQAAKMSRKRGRIVLVGVTGLELNRADFYEKELTFQVSCSYGPGRYDPEYEEKGHDYPIGYVRWTEQRNFEAVLDMMAEGRLDVSALISHRFKFEDAPEAYEVLGGGQSVLGILLEYGEQRTEHGRQKTEGSTLSSVVRDRGAEVGGQRTVKLGGVEEKSEVMGNQPVVGFIGAGNYASRILIPSFQKAEVKLQTIVTSGGTNGVIHGKKAGFEYASTDVDAMQADEQINTVVIATRHDTHARFVAKALEAGKHVFVEKPLCLSVGELDQIKFAIEQPSSGLRPLLMVGFNRRFAPQVQKMKTLLDPVKEPKSFIMTMNAGAIPSDHWTQDPSVGGGRIIGEACHFIDLMRFLAGSEIVTVQGRCMGDVPGVEVLQDKASIVLGFADGSFGTIHYLANGHGSFPKERVEVFCAGRVLQLDNFRKLRGFGWPGFRKMNLWRQDKGQGECVAAFVRAVEQGGPAPIAVDEIFEVARISIRAAEEVGGR